VVEVRAMQQESMFPEVPEVQGAAEPPTLPESARVVRPVRAQLEWTARSLDQSLPEDHLARAIWAFVEQLELGAFYASVRAVIDGPGRPASDPKALLALWVYATADGVGSARRLARLCEEHDAYRWLRGGVPVNYHMLSDFRVARKGEMGELLSQILAALMAGGLVKLERVAQDGVRLRASAGSASFRRRARLEHFLEQARAQVEHLAEEREHPDPRQSERERAARERAARERQGRIERALAEMPKVEAIKERQKRKLERGKRERVSEPRVSSTDAEARVMKMADGGFRPAFNAQLATDIDSQVIVGVSVVNQGTDEGLAAPMEAQVAERTGQHPSEYVVDGGFASLNDVVTLTRRGVTVYTPSRPPKGEVRRKDPTMPRPTDPPEVADWRVRMGTEEAKARYKDRGASAECVNAQVETRYGLRQLPVRGLGKALSVLLLVAATHNLLRWIALTT
jgi:transposase